MIRTFGRPAALILASGALLAACSQAPETPDVVFVGEIHDNPVHHARQAEAAAELAPAAIVFEMIPASAEDRLAELRAAGADRAALSEALAWEEGGWPDFGYYAQIWEAAPDARIYGAELKREVIRAALAGDETEVLGAGIVGLGLDDPLPEAEQMAREADQQKHHCGMLPDEALPVMVHAQRMRDASLADATLRALDETGGPVLVITGNGHARADWGAPSYIVAARPGLDVETVEQTEGPARPGAPYDRQIVAEPIERPDPCAAFRAG